MKETKVNTDLQKIEEILNRGTEEIFVKDHLREALLSGVPLRVKFGIDPTGPAIHLGRAIPLRKLKSFQDLGHTIVLIIGDFTAKIGDPSDKLEKRPMLADEHIKKNLEFYLDQISKIIDLEKTEIRYNSEWLAKMDYLETAKLLECFTVQQMSRRRNFRERIENGQDIFVVEFMYPALQGYDSVQVNADVEIGGFDQLFNLQAGRTVQKKYGQKEQDIMTLSMLEGTDGRKMSSSWGNIISLLDTKENMYGKVMAIRDDLILKYFKLCTDVSMEEISTLEKELQSGINPKIIKMKLARTIVEMYHGTEDAQKAEAEFEKTFAQGGVPEDMPTVSVAQGTLLVDVLLSQNLVSSKTEWRRLVDEGAVSKTEEGTMDGEKNEGEKISDQHSLAETGIYKIGKRRFIQISLL